MQKYLSDDIELISPLETGKGKAYVVAALGKFVSFLDTITIRAACGEGDHVMLALDVAAAGNVLKTAVFMTFKEHRIVRTELFYDARLLINPDSFA